jgi:acyl dehydratase
MSEHAQRAFASYEAAVGKSEGAGDWFEITQAQVNAFADVTLDHQFIHVDPERAAATPFGGPIAHGFLTLSMLVHLTQSVPAGDPVRSTGVVMGVNYGFDKVRFVSPVRVGKRIRASVVISDAQLKGNQIQITRTCTVEVEGEDKPALVADWITRSVFA